jgi:hypothetical protein
MSAGLFRFSHEAIFAQVRHRRIETGQGPAFQLCQRVHLGGRASLVVKPDLRDDARGQRSRASD